MKKISEKAKIRKNEIIQTAQNLFQIQGYEKTSVNQIITQLNISKGAFYHHFASKQALLEEIIERFTQASINQLQPILDDKNLNPIEKMNQVFSASIAFKTANISTIITLLETYYNNDNLILRKKFQQQSQKVTLPILTKLITEAQQAGYLHFQNGEATAEIIILLGFAISEKMAEVIKKISDNPDEFEKLEKLFIAYQESLERILGAQQGILKPLDFSLLDKIKEYYSRKEL
jgi:AcrR family transcriptional regulator